MVKSYQTDSRPDQHTHMQLPSCPHTNDVSVPHTQSQRADPVPACLIAILKVNTLLIYIVLRVKMWVKMS